MSTTDTTAGLSPPPDPRKDRAAKPVPKNIADLLIVLNILFDYSRHLADTLQYRASARGFSLLAQCFGTARLEVMYARVIRGGLRILALRNVLRARAARGRDLLFLGPRQRKARSKPPTGQTPDEPPGADTEAKPPRRPVRRPDTDAAPDLDHMPTIEELEALIRRRPIGCTVADICRDLGIAPRLCTPGFWNVLFEAITWMRGNLADLMRDFRRREVAFEPELRPTPQLGLPDTTRAGVMRVLGFFIGEPPRTPFPMPPRPDLAVATGPP